MREMNDQSPEEQRLESILKMLTDFSQGKFSIRETVGEDDHVLNAVISGLNMLGEELSNYESQIKLQSIFLQNILTSIDEVIYARNVSDDPAIISPFTFVSAGSEDIIGFTVEELQMNPELWANSIHPDDVYSWTEAIKKVRRNEEVVVLYRINFKGEGYRWIEDKAIPQNDENGVVTQIYGSARDVTEQQHNKVALVEKNEFISRIISTSDQFFYIVAIDSKDLAKSFNNNFTYVSWQIERIQGSNMQDLINNPKGWIDCIHPDDLEQVRADNKRMFSGKQPVTRVYRVKHAQRDEYIWLEDYVVPVVDDSGIIRELYGSARDINGRKMIELEREKLITELSQKYDDLMQFNYIVSHNLRAPVSHILGLAQLQNNGLSPEEKKTADNYMLQAASNLDELLHDLNAILSIRATLSEIKETFLLKEVIDSIYSTLIAEVNETGAMLQVDISPGAESVTTIKTYIQSAFLNLISNAIKYRAEERSPEIRISCAIKEGRTVIVVADNGMGIDLTSHKERMFGLYSKFTTTHEGKGLGLYMTKTQIESLGGTIDVESEEGVGTKFTIVL